MDLCCSWWPRSLCLLSQTDPEYHQEGPLCVLPTLPSPTSWAPGEQPASLIPEGRIRRVQPNSGGFIPTFSKQLMNSMAICKSEVTSFLHAFTYSFIHLPIHPPTHSSIHSSTHSTIYLPSHSSLHSSTHPPIHPFIHLPTHPFI